MLQNFNLKEKKSSALVEILVAITFFMLIVGTISLFSIDSVRTSVGTAKKDQANEIIKELVTGINQNKNDVWNNISSLALNTPKSVSFLNNKYTIIDGTTVTNGITTSFVLSSVNRDVSGNVVTSGGTLDPRSRKVTFTASWSDISTGNKSITYDYYINDWRTLELTETSQADFTDGTHTYTAAINNSGGEVALDQIFFPDWCKPTTALSTYDIPGNATAKTVFGLPNRAYLGTGGNATGVAFTNLSITGVNPPVIAVDGTFNGYITNNIFVLGNYAYLATSDATKKVVILDISTSPYTEVGNFQPNPSTAQIARSVYVVGTVGYVAIGQYVHTFNLTGQNGPRAQYSRIKVVLNANFGYSTTANVSRIIVRGNYLFASLDQDLYELVILNVSNPSSMSRTSQSSVNNSQTFDIFVSPDGTRTYFGTGYKSNESQFFIINTSNKSSPSIIGSYKTDGMNVRAIAIIAADKRAILVGDAGAQQYIVLNTTTEATPTKCGGVAITGGVNDIDVASDVNGNVFSYFVTNDAVKDFQIIRGGPGVGGGSNGYGYSPNGSYVSGVLDTNDAGVRYLYVKATGTVAANTTMKLQLRTSASSNMSSPTAWMDHTGNTTNGIPYNTLNTFSWNAVNNKRYIQYMITITSDTLLTPVLSDITLTYQ